MCVGVGCFASDLHLRPVSTYLIFTFSGLAWMASIEHLPAELLLKIWRMLPYFEDSNRMENPIINWHSKDTLFFQHDLAPKADLIVSYQILHISGCITEHV